MQVRFADEPKPPVVVPVSVLCLSLYVSSVTHRAGDLSRLHLTFTLFEIKKNLSTGMIDCDELNRFKASRLFVPFDLHLKALNQRVLFQNFSNLFKRDALTYFHYDVNLMV